LVPERARTIANMTDKNIVPVAEVLAPEECWKLLRETAVGRLAVTVEGRPDVFPVHYKVDQETLLFRTGSGTKERAIETDSAVALEADSVSGEFGIAWSVVVKGHAAKTTSESTGLEAISRALFPWQGVGKDHLVRIIPDAVTGRRFTVRSPMAWVTSLDDATRAGLE
jgi:nitroimidazol reductase NimA-like FMN-containing flavoprotein (pyridoxamine 5'-phosphate oxidase superfamily)